MHKWTDVGIDYAHVPAPALQSALTGGGRRGEPLRAVGFDSSGGKQHFAPAFAVAMFGDTHAAAGLPARLRQSNKSLRERVIAPPDSLCILRLSALGDVSHVVPLVRTVQRHWPATRITWIVGQFESRLVGDIEGVEFIPYDKRSGWRGVSGLRRRLKGRRFDALLLMQLALRANLVSTAIRADVRVGYDRARSKEGHGLFINRRIPPCDGQHVLDALGSFLQPLGLPADEPPRWSLPVPDEAVDFARSHIPDDGQRTLVISPCASHALRNWRPERYAAVADHAIRRHGLRVLLCGGPSPAERTMGDAILAHCTEPVVDLIGKDTIKRALALLQRADLVVSPDSGPVHMANAVGTPVLGLYAATDPRRSGPYSDRRWTVDRYAAAAERFLGKGTDQLPWGRKIEVPGVMDLIETDAVIERLDAWVFDTSRP
jgi:heptosyltransferase I